MKKPTKAEIKRLKKLCEKEIVQWLSVLSQLEELEERRESDCKIKQRFVNFALERRI